MSDRESRTRYPIHYQTNGDGSPLVLIHGDFSDGAATWPEQRDSLAEHHRLIVVDRRGHGRSTRQPYPYTIAGDACDVLDVCDRERIQRFHLVGHSYGGLVACEIARRVPGRIHTVHLIEPPYLSLLRDHTDIAPLVVRSREIHRMAIHRTPEETAEAFFAMLAGEGGISRLRESPGWLDIVREARRFAHSQFPDEYPAGAVSALPRGGGTVVYTGDKSHPGLRRLAAELASRVPGARLVTIPDSHHAVQFSGRAFNHALLAVTTNLESIT